MILVILIQMEMNRKQYHLINQINKSQKKIRIKICKN